MWDAKCAPIPFFGSPRWTGVGPIDGGGESGPGLGLGVSTRAHDDSLLFSLGFLQ